jgi:hypothetical protein
MILTNRPLEYHELAGMFAMSMLPRPRPSLSIIRGGVRPLGDRLPRPATATLTSIQGGKENQQ